MDPDVTDEEGLSCRAATTTSAEISQSRELEETDKDLEPE